MDPAAYPARIGHREGVGPHLATLQALHGRHLLTVPFEKLDIHLARPIILREAAFFEKLVGRRREGSATS